MKLQSLHIFLHFLLVCTVLASAPKCPLTNGTNAIVTCAVYEYQCPPGDKLVGSSQLTCGSDGKWSSDPSVCQDECKTPLGMESGAIPDERVTASSVHGNLLRIWAPDKARLNYDDLVNAWSPAANDQSQWLQVDLGRLKNVSGIITQGASNLGRIQYVSAYKVQYRGNGVLWQVLKDPTTGSDKIFEGNMDNDTPKENMFNSLIVARYVRIVPWKWQERITLRMELLGCRDE